MVMPIAKGGPANAGGHANGTEAEPVFDERQRPDPDLGTVHKSSIGPTTDKTAGDVPRVVFSFRTSEWGVSRHRNGRGRRVSRHRNGVAGSVPGCRRRA